MDFFFTSGPFPWMQSIDLEEVDSPTHRYSVNESTGMKACLINFYFYFL